MVAVIKTGSSLRRVLYYNEQKVKAGVAECILAVNYPKDVDCLTLTNKLNRLLHQAALNEKVTRNSVHISLNFDPSEKLQPDQLKEIAQTYMQKIGFGEQPYLVYQHFDAGHPHIHLVTVKVRADGNRIDMRNIGRNQSEKARLEIEQVFSLVKASERKKQRAAELKPVNVQKIQYGQMDTKRAITSVLDAVLNQYKFTSLPELNAVLKLYNVTADQGTKNSRVYQHQGLLYRIVDNEGNRVGVLIKASNFYNKPTLSFLKERFRANEVVRQQHKNRVKTAIDRRLLKQPGSSLASLQKALQKEGIDTVERKNAEGLVYGLTFVDHKTKCVFNGSDLGKSYTANALQQRCVKPEVDFSKSELNPQTTQSQVVPDTSNPTLNSGNNQVSSTPFKPEIVPLLNTLLQPEPAPDYVPSELKKNPRKKKKKRISD